MLRVTGIRKSTVRLVLSNFLIVLAIAAPVCGCSRSEDGSGASQPSPAPAASPPKGTEGAKPAPGDAKPTGDSKIPAQVPAKAEGSTPTKADGTKPAAPLPIVDKSAAGNPPERELTFGKYKIKLRLVTGNHTKNAREEIQPYYIAVEPLPYGILRYCGELAGCETPASGEDQDSATMQRVSVDDSKRIIKMLNARLPSHAEWVNAHHAGVIKRMDCELTQFNKISIVEEHGADGVFETPLSDEIRFTYQREDDAPRTCGMRIALDAEIMSTPDKP